jgi:hypothetical protein
MPDEVESWLDHVMFLFRCTKCGYPAPNLSVGSIRDDQTTLTCASCHFENDLTAAPNSDTLATARRTAFDADSKARAAGKTVKRSR